MKANTLKGLGTTIGHSTVTWDGQTQSYGRNGSINTTGVSLSLHHRPKEDAGDLTLAVITSRGQVSHNCFIELPADPKALHQLANELKSAAQAIEDGKVGNLAKV